MRPRGRLMRLTNPPGAKSASEPISWCNHSTCFGRSRLISCFWLSSFIVSYRLAHNHTYAHRSIDRYIRASRCHATARPSACPPLPRASRWILNHWRGSLRVHDGKTARKSKRSPAISRPDALYILLVSLSILVLKLILFLLFCLPS
jgi:hypothetical protein